MLCSSKNVESLLIPLSNSQVVINLIDKYVVNHIFDNSTTTVWHLCPSEKHNNFLQDVNICRIF